MKGCRLVNAYRRYGGTEESCGRCDNCRGGCAHAAASKTTAVAPKRQKDSKRSTCKMRWACFAKKVPRWHHGHVGRGNRLLEPASLREQKDKRQRHRSIVPVASVTEIVSMERAPRRRATAMVEDGIVKFFAVLSRVGGSDTLDKVAKSVPGCKGISENATFRATSRRFATQNTVAKGPDTERARVV